MEQASVIIQRLWFPVLLLVAVWVGYMAAVDTPSKDVSLTVEVAPIGSSITIDGDGVRGGTHKVVAGTHRITATKKGFKSQTQTITTKPGDTSYAGFILEASDPDLADWYENNEADQKWAEGISSHISDYESERTFASNSILQLLPYSFGNGKGDLIEISFGTPLVRSSTQQAVYVTADMSDDRQAALDWIKNNGFDPTNVDIVFYSQLDNYADPEESE